MSPPITVFLMQGAWHTPTHAQFLISAFATAGIECENCWCPSTHVTNAKLPSSKDDEAAQHPDFSTPRPTTDPWPDAHTDARFVEARLRQLVEDEGKLVLVIAHSWGGIPASEACKEALCLPARKAVGKKGGVFGILFLTAFCVPVGMSTIDYVTHGPGGGDASKAFEVWPSGLVTCNDPERCLFSPTERTAHAALIKRMAESLTAQPMESNLTRLEYAGYRNVSCGYVVCEEDTMIPVAMQESLVASLKGEQGAPEVKVWRCRSGHEPAITQPELVKGIAVKFADGVLGRGVA